jgi:single-strand DNA-binding protein
MKTFCRVTMIGHVGSEVVLRYTQSGKPVVNLRLATSERKKEGNEATSWHRIVLWDALAELAKKFVTKGQPLYIEGALAVRDWTDGEGKKHFQAEITAREMVLLGSKGAPRVAVDGAGPSTDEILASSGGEGDEAGDADVAGGPVLVHPGLRTRDGEERGEVVADIPF